MVPIGKDLNLASKILLSGGVISFPTETVMGLGVVYDNFDAYSRLNKLKGKREDKPYTMMLANTSEISNFAELDDRSKKIISSFMPGPITILLKAKDTVPSWVTHDKGVVGIRVPDFPLLNELLNIVKKPLLVPSANPSNLSPALTVNQVNIYFNETLDYIVNNDSLGELPSTIVDLTGDSIKIIREGKILKEDIFKSLGEKL